MPDAPTLMFLAVALALAAALVMALLRFGSFRALMFWSRIRRTVGEMRMGSEGRVLVHVLDREDGKRIGLETWRSGKAAYLRLTRAQAEHLRELLAKAEE